MERCHVREIGGDSVSVRITALDAVSDEELPALTVLHGNGRDNAWHDEPAETRHL